MDARGTDGSESLERRVASLEARVRLLESLTPRAAEPAARPVPPSSFASSASPQIGAAAAGAGSAPKLSGTGPLWSKAPDGPSTAPVDLQGRSASLPGGAQDAAASAPATPGVPFSLADLEARMTGRALAWVGGLALVLGAIFFLNMAFSRGWIGPELRVVIGLAAGTIAMVVGGFLLVRGDRLVGHVLTPVGLAVISISMVGATRLFDLVPVPVGLLVVLLSAIGAAALAVRTDSPVVAAFGLVAVLASPPLLGSAPDVTTLAFVGAVLVGTSAVSVWRTWGWLPPLAFLLSAPQAAFWILGDPEPSVGLLGIGLFWLVNIVAAGGEEFRRRQQTLSPSSASLLLGNAAFLVWAGFQLLDADLIGLRGVFLVLVALGHLAVGAYFLRRDGDRTLFGLLTAGTGIAALTMAAPIQLEAPAVPVAWAAEAVALAWLAARRDHRYSARASGVLYGMAGTAVIWLQPGAAEPSTVPFANPEGAGLVFFIAAVAAGTWLARRGWTGSALAAWGLVVAARAAPGQLDDVALVAAWAGLLVVGLAIVPLLADGRVGAPVAGGRVLPFDPWLPLASLGSWALAVGHVLAVELPIDDFGTSRLPAIPFTDDGAIAVAVLVATALAGASVLGERNALRSAVAASGLLVAYAIPYEVGWWATAVMWSGLAVAAVVAMGLPIIAHPFFRVASAGLIVAAACVAIGLVAPPSRLVVSSVATDPLAVLQAVASIGACVAAASLLARTEPSRSRARWAWIGAGVAAAYVLSVVVVDLVGLTLREGVDIEELRRRGHVALSVLWALLGIAAFVVGLRTKAALLRQAGLALLAITAVKVFVFDLAALDVAYRVISLVALGLVFLAGAWLWQRSQPKPPIHGGVPPA